jgi:hypothetical protein
MTYERSESERGDRSPGYIFGHLSNHTDRRRNLISLIVRWSHGLLRPLATSSSEVTHHAQGSRHASALTFTGSGMSARLDSEGPGFTNIYLIPPVSLRLSRVTVCKSNLTVWLTLLQQNRSLHQRKSGTKWSEIKSRPNSLTLADSIVSHGDQIHIGSLKSRSVQCVQYTPKR